MKAKLFLSTPSSFKNREHVSRDQIKITDVDNNIITFNVKNKYKSRILFEDGKILPSTEVKFHCDCDSFKYQFSQRLALSGSNIELPVRSMRLPKKQPIGHICKHLEASLNQVMIFKNIEQLRKKLRI